ncbi:uncharacterized protein CcaverHIS019_0100090 [Cutaneotrichosporon cavernicola]|uniref:Phenol 2-monooxygenase n=1 Tax=Cutaneotrichosporon cavernicola TaxID=279322 RepID=A0AA48KY85_9TREE|nr:uncharacterized protein CcaverHIS019_0100090 [Cutaneotrichosporon cavernicola]BEI87291.1 hypothetical protein CcaverHIS019_0100090 [Cutaneotrichosporon cavernicola]BEI95061.1 hypothetical protein CcaverHIS631_0100100 [Cutaneotrichosporon cavernicola]BEJ02835.1 hypothetical protein CcaverHIS641_0100100 [Cutaneotrichosporon cavernicola]
MTLPAATNRNTNESKVDVLIVGAGPAGLMLATQLSKLKIDTRVVDKMAHPVLRGHADGLQCRTGEVFEALNVHRQFDAETHECAEVIIWDPDQNGDIRETSRVVDTVPGMSRVKHVNLGQDRVEAIFMEAMKKANNLEVERLITPTSFKVDEASLDDNAAYPITVTLKKLTPPAEWANGDVKSGMYRSNLFTDESQTAVNAVNADHSGEETVHCKYLVGCDGARSWVRKNLGLELKGDSANVYWGAFDAVVDSDLPTTRMKNVIHSKDAGAVLMVPREDGMVRVYTQMGELKPGERVDRDAVTIDKLMEKTRQVLHPYRIDFPYIDWYTCYEIGQRVCDTFSQYKDHILIAGDACHTHSPKAGQGMNVSMMDTFNLGWKLASVLRGQAKRDILQTYQLERQKTAHQLIEFDRKFSALFTGKAKTAERAGVSPEEMRKAWDDSIRFTSGTGVVYEPNLIVGKPNPWLAKNITVGSHFENHQVVGAFNGHALQLQGRLLADGRWRIVIFPGDIRHSENLTALKVLGDFLGSNGPATKYTPKGEDLDSVIQTLTVFATPHREVQYAAPTLPSILQPTKKPHGIKDFDCFMCDEPSYHDGDGKAYLGYGIDPLVGCVVVVRPDQHVSGVYAMDEVEEISNFFDSFMLVPQSQ